MTGLLKKNNCRRMDLTIVEEFHCRNCGSYSLVEPDREHCIFCNCKKNNCKNKCIRPRNNCRTYFNSENFYVTEMPIEFCNEHFLRVT